ncbi:protein rapunzel-like [Myripristis murdjan]|uniref:protein rapunzel-like n=1 Tax=Myripristis murdjan TaxID=586833 RepID=UPI0011763407|nr:protein rapunzel-like [Myripristis murdjan]
MTSPLEAVAQKKPSIEAVMDMLEKGPEVLASAVGELLPLFEAVVPVLRLALENIQSKEVSYIKEQFLTLRNKLDVLSTQLEDLYREMEKSRQDLQYSVVEDDIRYQYKMFTDILRVKQELKGEKKNFFLDQFVKAGGEKNLFVLYDALMGNSSFGESVLDVVERYAAGNRRLLEDFCVGMKKLLLMGLIALLGHCALNQGPDGEEEKKRDWSIKMKEVEFKMKSTIESCVGSFPEHARSDAQRLFREKGEGNPADTAQELKEFLKTKYDWVSWSVRLISDSGKFFGNQRAGKDFHHVCGQNCFEFPPLSNMNLVVSYSTKPQPVPRGRIQRVMEDKAKKGNAKAVADVLKEQLHGFVVHAISRHKTSTAACSFPEDCHYWERHKNMAVCVHSE